MRIVPHRFLALLLLAMSVGCGPIEEAPEPKLTTDVGIDDVSSPDVGPDVSEEDTGPQFVCPNEGEKVCDGKCINVLISMDHCGECDNTCIRGTMTCAGVDGCQCLDERIMCGTRCYDSDTSREHCGECDNECAISEACLSGTCTLISEDPIVLGVLSATNDARAEGQDCGVEGVKPPADGVQLNEQLNIAAQIHAEDMAANDFMDHTGSDGSSPAQRAERAGYTGQTGENVARGYETAEGAVAGWVDSDGHCKNLMERDFSVMGVGHAVSDRTGEHFWAQLFGDR